MKTPGLRPLTVGSGLLCLAVLLGAAWAAGLSGHSLQVWTGTGAGLAMGLAGLAAAVVCIRRARHGGDAAFWGAWGAGLAARVLVMATAALVFWLVWPESYAAPMLSMAGAWLAVHCLEIGWLCSLPREATGG